MSDLTSTLDARIRQVRRLPWRARLAALAHALQIATEDERARLSPELVELALRPEPGPKGDAQSSRGLLRFVPHAERFATRLTSSHNTRADRALATALSLWPTLSPETQAALVSLPEARWADATARILRETGKAGSDPAVTPDPDGPRRISMHPTPRLNAALACAERASPAVAAAVLPSLHDADDEVAQAAEHAVLRAVLSVTPDATERTLRPEYTRRGPPPVAMHDPSDEAARALAASLVFDALSDAGQDRRTGLALSALLLMGVPVAIGEGRTAAMVRLRGLLRPGDQPAGAAFRGALRRSKAPIVRARALVLAADPAFANAACTRLACASTTAEHEALLCQTHLLHRPRRARAVGEVRVRARATGGDSHPGAIPSGSPVPDPEVFARLRPEARRGLWRWAACIDADDRAREAMALPCLLDPDPFVRFSAVGVLPVAAGGVLADFIFDPHPAVARRAALRWSALGVGRAPLLAAAVDAEHGAGPEDPRRMIASAARSPHPGVRRIGTSDLAALIWPDPRSVGASVAARRWLRRDRAGFLASLGERVREGSPEDRIGAILLARRLELADAIGDGLVRIALDERAPAKVRATAGRALAGVKSADAASALRAMLDDDEPRVRANAADALARAHWGGRGRPGEGPSGGPLLELKADAHHRPRGAALRALIERSGRHEAGRAADGVLSMLHDQRPGFRLAGLWAAERTGVRSKEVIRGHVPVWLSTSETLAHDDPEAAVRARAARCADRLAWACRRWWGGSGVIARLDGRGGVKRVAGGMGGG